MLFSCEPALAVGISAGASFGYININDPNYREISSTPYSKSLSIGVNHIIDKEYLISIQTDRLINRSYKKQVVNNGGIILDSKYYTKSDSLLVAKIVNRSFYGAVISNTMVEKSISYKGRAVGDSKTHSILYGLVVGYFLTKNISTSIIYIAPNSEINLEGALLSNINYLF